MAGKRTTTTPTTATLPALVNVVVRMEKVKQVQANLVVAEGVVQKPAAGAALRTDQSCLVHIRNRNDVQWMLKFFDVHVLEAKTRQPTTRWTELPQDDSAFIVAFQVDIASRAVERNRKGTVLLECHEILSIHKRDEDLVTMDWNEIDDIQHSDDLTIPSPMNNKGERNRLFASWLVDTYGHSLLSSGAGVLDVAGGNGELSAALLNQGVQTVVLLDPKPRLCERAIVYEKMGRLTTFAEALFRDGSSLTDQKHAAADKIKNCSIVVGMHPDQATEPIVDLAQRLNVPFAVLPCCVMPSLFPNRRQKRHCDMPVRSYRTFCKYLVDKAPEGSTYCEAHLAFVGRNKIIYHLPD